MIRASLRPWAAELLGTALLVGIGTGTIVAAGRIGGIPQWAMAIAWFLAVFLPIQLFAPVSGAHLNPAVTLALATSRRVPWRIVPGHVAAQLLGALAGSAVVLLLLGAGQHLGATIPVGSSLVLDFAGEALFTALLVASVFVLADRGPGRYHWRDLLPALAVGASTYLIGPLTGSSLNPARTLAPALLSGTYTGLGLYLTIVPIAALAVALTWSRPRRGGRGSAAGAPPPERETPGDPSRSS